MSEIFLISDFHFDHSNILNFTKTDGTPLRPGFSDVNHMNEHMVDRYNSVVKSDSKVYILGDIAMKDKGISYLSRLNGKKTLILGNHDYPEMRLYAPYFKHIYSTRRLDTMILSHIPVHPLSLGGKLVGNIHGHVHDNVPAGHFGPRYFNVSVEVTGYAPVPYEVVKQKILKQLEASNES